MTAVIACTSAAFAGEPRYRLIDLGATLPTAINNRGQVVGTTTSADRRSRSSIWEQGTFRDLGLLDGYYSVYANDLNDAGVVTGMLEGKLPGTPFDIQVGFLYDGKTQAIPRQTSLSAGALGINSNGHVAGYYSDLSGSHASLYDGLASRDLGNLGGYSFATNVNNRDQVVGYSFLGPASALPYHAFLFNGVMRDLGTLPGHEVSIAYKINNRGEIIGQSWVDETLREGQSFLYRDGVMTEFKALSGRQTSANAINDEGVVVGSASSIGPAFGLHAFVSDAAGSRDLNELIEPGSGWTLNTAVDINNAGWIVGRGVFESGPEHGYVLIPVPEPCLLAPLASACVFIHGIRRRRHAPTNRA